VSELETRSRAFMCCCSRCSLGTLHWGSHDRRGKCGRSSGCGHFDCSDGRDYSITTSHRRCTPAFRGDRGVVRVGACSAGRSAGVGGRSADMVGPASKARGRARPFKTVHRARVQDFSSHCLLPLALASCSQSSFASAVPTLLAFPTHPRLRRRDVELDALQRVLRAAPPSR
jgi:hypothetical protein